MARSKVVTKRDLDLRVAVDLKTSRTRVTRITNEFVAAIREALVNTGQVEITGLGKLTATVIEFKNRDNLVGTHKSRHDNKAVRISFSKTRALRDLMRHQPRRKYARRRDGKIRS